MITREQVIAYNKEVKEALETVFSALNRGQQQKLLNNEKVKALFDRYKIKYEE